MSRREGSPKNSPANAAITIVTLIYPKKPYNNLIRLSTGIEDVNDLIADFEQAFEAIKK